MRNSENKRYNHFNMVILLINLLKRSLSAYLPATTKKPWEFFWPCSGFAFSIFTRPTFWTSNKSKTRTFAFLVLQMYIPTGMLKYLFQKGGSKKLKWRQKKKYQEAIHKHKKKQTQKHNEDNHCHVSTCIDVGRCCGPPYANRSLQNRVS